MRKSLLGNWVAAALAVAVLFACVSVPATAEEAGGRTHIVEIRKLQFSPAELEVAPRDTITWINYDLVPHTDLTGETPRAWREALRDYLGSGADAPGV